MRNRRALGAFLPSLLAAISLALGVACSSGSSASSPSPAPSSTQPPPSPTAAPTPTPVPPPLDLRATRLAIPSLGIDTTVEASYETPQTSQKPAGCPAKPSDNEDTLTVPTDGGVATPDSHLDGLENRAWIFGHSRWLGVPGLFFHLADLNVGDAVYIDAVDRATGKTLQNAKFVVDGLYLADTDSGDSLVIADSPEQVPTSPTVVLQTSAREDGYGKQWILNQQEVLSKAKNVVDGDLTDPCLYLLLFVTAHLAT